MKKIALSLTIILGMTLNSFSGTGKEHTEATRDDNKKVLVKGGAIVLIGGATASVVAAPAVAVVAIFWGGLHVLSNTEIKTNN